MDVFIGTCISERLHKNNGDKLNEQHDEELNYCDHCLIDFLG